MNEFEKITGHLWNTYLDDRGYYLVHKLIGMRLHPDTVGIFNHLRFTMNEVSIESYHILVHILNLIINEENLEHEQILFYPVLSS